MTNKKKLLCAQDLSSNVVFVEINVTAGANAGIHVYGGDVNLLAFDRETVGGTYFVTLPLFLEIRSEFMTTTIECNGTYETDDISSFIRLTKPAKGENTVINIKGE